MSIIYSSKPLPERKKLDFYPTPIELCRAAVNQILPKDFQPYSALDPGAGEGVWGKAVVEKYPDTYMCGVEIRDVSVPESYVTWQCGDFLEMERRPGYYDLIVGNPPYYLGEEFVLRGLDYVNDDGYLLFLLRLSVLESKKRFDKFYNTSLRPIEVWVSTRRVSFTRDRKTDNTPYAMYLWKKENITGETKLNWLDWNYEQINSK